MHDAYITFLAVLVLIAIVMFWVIGKTENDGTIPLNWPIYIIGFVLICLFAFS